MKTVIIVSSAVLLVVIGIVIMLFTIKNAPNSFGYLLMFSVGLGLFVGPIIGILISIRSNRRYER